MHLSEYASFDTMPISTCQFSRFLTLAKRRLSYAGQPAQNLLLQHKTS